MLRNLMTVPTPRVLAACAMTLTSVTLAPATLSAETEEERITRCTGQAQIVTLAVEKRQELKSAKKAVRQIRRAEGIKDTDFEGHVDLLVNWVYSLPAEQLGPEATTAFEAACSEYSG